MRHLLRNATHELLPFVVLLLLGLLLVSSGCSFFDDPFRLETTVPGLVQADTRNTDFRAYGALEDAVRADGQAVLVTRVEFSEAARGTGIDLPPTRVALVNAATISQALVAADPLAALEFPQPILIYTVDEDRVVAGYNTAAYLAARYDVAGLPALDDYEERWQRFVASASSGGAFVAGPGPSSGVRHEGIEEVALAVSVDDAYRLLNQAVRAREDLQTVARYDHTVEGGRSVITVLFNQPETAARLAAEVQTAGIDALVRVVLYEDDGGATRLAYVAPSYAAARHAIDRQAAGEVASLQALLDALVDEVVKASEGDAV